MKATSPMRTGRIHSSESSSSPAPKQQHHRSPRFPKENADPNVPFPQEPRPSKPPLPFKNRSPLPPRPPLPPGNPLKRKLNLEAAQEGADSGVQVILRMRPLSVEEGEGNSIVQKVSPDSVAVLDHSFTFDSVADTGSTQEDIFQLVGVPLVENCLAGFNSSIFAYGQTGSGKTYTMWGPLSALSKVELSIKERGLTPRVFERLFSRIKEEQIKHSNKQLSYQCRCSFLEIYNEQITDLLDPIHGNLQIREDVRTGIYVENLTEDYVCSTGDVIQLLTKGLENRRTGATSINAESSRSHCVFTCIVESRSKSISDGLSSVRTSRINLVDLAGSERQKQTGAAGDRLKEAGNINRSLSQLGNLINILAEISQSGKQRHIPYRDSRLTFLLQESLGGNAKLAMICAVSLSQSCKSETFSTLRFAQRAKAIRNKAVVNEVTQDDVNVLREQIRQLKDELLRMKSNGDSTGNNGSYSTGWNARRSLTILRQSLSHPRAVKLMDEDNDEEMEIDEADVEKPYIEAKCLQSAACEKNVDDVDKTTSNFDVLKQKSLNNQELPSERAISGDLSTDQVSDMEVCGSEVPITDKAIDMCNMNTKDCESEEIMADQFGTIIEVSKCNNIANNYSNRIEQGNSRSILASMDPNVGDKSLRTSEGNLLNEAKQQRKTLSDPNRLHKSLPRSSSIDQQSCLSIVPLQINPVSELPISNLSPRTENCIRKSLRSSLSTSASRKDMKEVEKAVSGNLTHIRSSVSNNSLAPTEHLAKSIHHGLQIFDLHQQKSSLRRSCFNFSIKPVDLKPSLPVTKVDCGIQTFSQESQSFEDQPVYVCSYCKNKAPPLEYKDVSVDTELQLVPVDELYHSGKLIKQVPKAVEKVLAGAIRREMALEDHCAKQAAEIAHLNRLVQQYKHERECNIVIEQTREGKICRLEGLMDGIIPIEHYMEDEFTSLANEHKLLKEKFENHPEVLRVKVELKRVQDELDGYKNFFDLGERDILIEEIQDLRCQLQYYVDSPMVSQKQSSLLKLTYTNDANMAGLKTLEPVEEECANEKLQEERRHWTETESKWISLAEELRLELEVTRSRAGKQKMELDSEKKCLMELKEALQMAMQGHACILDQYADLQEKHVQLLARHRKIRDGVADVKKAAVRAGVKGTESKFIDALAAEISALKAEREKERRYWKDENKGLQAQLKDTAEAVQAAGELLVRLKEAEEVATLAQKRIDVAEKEVEKCHLEINSLKKTHETEIAMLNQFLAESQLPREALKPAYCDAEVVKYDSGGSLTNQRWKEFEPFSHGSDNDFSRGAEHHSWFSDYDRCNI